MSRNPPSTAEMKAKAEAWYQSQLEKLSKAHGAAWEGNREWVEDYLREELRLRLVAIGWRPAS